MQSFSHKSTSSSSVSRMQLMLPMAKVTTDLALQSLRIASTTSFFVSSNFYNDTVTLTSTLETLITVLYQTDKQTNKNKIWPAVIPINACSTGVPCMSKMHWLPFSCPLFVIYEWLSPSWFESQKQGICMQNLVFCLKTGFSCLFYMVIGVPFSFRILSNLLQCSNTWCDPFKVDTKKLLLSMPLITRQLLNYPVHVKVFP